jgi:hypothetical protein
MRARWNEIRFPDAPARPHAGDDAAFRAKGPEGICLKNVSFGGRSPIVAAHRAGSTPKAANLSISNMHLHKK